MHDALHPSAGPHLHQIRRLYVALGLILVALILLGALILIRQDKTRGSTTGSETFNPVPASLLSAVTQIPDAVSNAVGVDTPTYAVVPPKATKGQALWQAAVGAGPARPVVFFYDAEFSPYAAAQRWPLVIALSRFGTFTQLGLAQSSGTEVFPGLSSFTFWRTEYNSRWVTLLAVERYGSVNPTDARYVSLQHPDRTEAAAVAAFDNAGSTLPLLDLGNRFVLTGSSFTPAALANMSQNTIAADLAYPTSPATQAVLSAANEITAAICATTGERPGSVCSSRGVLEADQRMHITSGH
jgi:hypothetical protein